MEAVLCVIFTNWFASASTRRPVGFLCDGTTGYNRNDCAKLTKLTSDGLLMARSNDVEVSNNTNQEQR
jgi:hypothetical protein